MKIADQSVVSIHYTLTNDAGDILDTSEHSDPLVYLHGAGNIIPGLENALLTKAAGDSFKVSIEPAQGYGEHDETMVQQVPKDAFQGVQNIEVGMQFQARSDQGAMTVTVTGVDGDTVTIDANHPLAGERLHFAIEVVEVRTATQEELTHGHAHGPGDHHHH